MQRGFVALAMLVRTFSITKNTTSYQFGTCQHFFYVVFTETESITVSPTDANIDAVSEMYSSDLPNLQTLDVEYHRWTRKWQSERSQPDTLQPALEVQNLMFLFFNVCFSN